MSSKKGSKTPLKKMDIHTFVGEMAARQTVLLQAMVTQIRSGEISVVDDGLDENSTTARYIGAVVNDWCDNETPSLESHMTMASTIFYWALLDEAFADSTQVNARHAPASNSTSNRDVVMEALKTIQALWGQR